MYENPASRKSIPSETTSTLAHNALRSSTKSSAESVVRRGGSIRWTVQRGRFHRDLCSIDCSANARPQWTRYIKNECPAIARWFECGLILFYAGACTHHSGSTTNISRRDRPLAVATSINFPSSSIGTTDCKSCSFLTKYCCVVVASACDLN